MNYKKNWTAFHLAGWLLFLICSFLFLYAAVRDKDTVLTLASLVFLGGCIVFLIPLLSPAPTGKKPIESEGVDTSTETG